MPEFLVKLETNFDYQKLYDDFYKDLANSTGTILVHHGKAKFPGKYVKNYSEIELFIKDKDAEDILINKAKEIFENYSLNKLYAVHNIGKIYKNDSILFLAVEAKDRVSAFDAVRELLEFIKDETLLGLTEKE